MNVKEYLYGQEEREVRVEYMKCNISQSTKEYLCKIGLPSRPTHFISFNLNEIKNIYLDNKYIIVGSDYGMALCIDKNEEIVAVDKEHEYPNRFVNSNLECLLRFIMVYLQNEELLARSTDEDISSIIETIKKEFVKIDSKALSNVDNWWEIILE